MLQNPHELSIVQLHTSAMGAAVNLAGLEELSVPPNTEIRGGATAGTIYSEHESVSAQKPEMTFTSVASIKACLDNIGLLGKKLTAGANVGLAAFLAKREHGSTYATGASHRRYRMADGIVVPTTLRAGFQEDVRISYQAFGTYDGANAPIQEQDGQTIPTSPAPIRNERFTLYSISAGTTPVVLQAATSVEVAFNVAVLRPEGATGVANELIWPTFASINQVVPVITISGLDPTWVSAAKVPLLGKANTHAGTELKLIRRLHGSTFYGIAATEHIKITADGLTSVEQIVSANDKDNATTSLRITTRFDGTNAPLRIFTGVAL